MRSEQYDNGKLRQRLLLQSMHLFIARNIAALSRSLESKGYEARKQELTAITQLQGSCPHVGRQIIAKLVANSDERPHGAFEC